MSPKRKAVIGFAEVAVLEVAQSALRRSSAYDPKKPERGWGWMCYCPTCCNLRKVIHESSS